MTALFWFSLKTTKCKLEYCEQTLQGNKASKMQAVTDCERLQEKENNIKWREKWKNKIMKKKKVEIIITVSGNTNWSEGGYN